MVVELPIDPVLPEILETLSDSGICVLQAPPGAGKTTRVPPALLPMLSPDHPHLVMLEPRRIAARSAAARIAVETDSMLGRVAGYAVRFDSCLEADTPLRIMTEGILLRQLQSDPYLEQVSCVVFDEFHERRLDSDLILAMVRRLRNTVRPDLRLLIMSATLDAAGLAKQLGDCPVICCEGIGFPVHIRYERRRSAERASPAQRTAEGIELLLKQTEGDVLAFLPGVGEIAATERILQGSAAGRDAEIMRLHGSLPADQQDRVLRKQARRKIVLATNVAETSITIDGISAVVDSGLVRELHFDPAVGLERLQLTGISRSSADQRAGRAGRTAAGVCLRLWDEASHRRMPEVTPPEIVRSDLSTMALRLSAWGENDIRGLDWLTPPPEDSAQRAIRLLELLGAVDESGITESGRQMSQLPVHPRSARILLESLRLRCEQAAVVMAAMLSERDPFLRSQAAAGRRSAPGRNGPHTARHRRSSSDVVDRLIALTEYFAFGQQNSEFGSVHHGAASDIRRSAQQLLRLLAESAPGSSGSLSIPHPEEVRETEELLRKCLLAGFPDRVTRRREPGSDRGLMTGGRGVRLEPQSGVRDADLFICIDVDDKGANARVRQASAVEEHWLPERLMSNRIETFFDPSRKEVSARRRVRYCDLILEEFPAAVSDMTDAADTLYRAARHDLDQLMSADERCITLLTRIRFLAGQLPEAELPVPDTAFFDELLRDAVQGLRSFSELKKVTWAEMIRGRLTYEQLQLLDREAPETIQVPSGSRIRLQYNADSAPVLAVRIQEMFGSRETPKVARGRVRVLLHLLAPNMRPQQVTDDLAAFWERTYETVRKELKRRYPKHSWPDDPADAPPLSRGRNRR